MKSTALVSFVGAKRVHQAARFPKTGPGVGTCADIRKSLTHQQSAFLWQRGIRRVRHARAVLVFNAANRLARLKAICKAVGFSQ